MLGAFQGFWVIIGIALVGYVAARRGLFDRTTQQVLARVSFFIASPALLFSVLAHTPVAQVLSWPIVVALGSIACTVTLYLLVARRRWPKDLGGSVISSMCAAYVNAGNLGLPIAAYVLGDVAYMAPTLLLQQVFVTPLAMTLMEIDGLGRRPRPRDVLAGVVRNPLTLAAMSGVVLSLLGRYPPEALMRPVTLIGQMAVPGMLLAFGISLHVGGRPGASGEMAHVVWITCCKLVAQPVFAFVLATAAGLQGRTAMACVVTASLPAAQNVFTHAVRYDRETLLARDAVLVTTLCSAPAILAVVLLLG